MSDTRFDGKRIYEYGRATQAVFDVRGKYIHKANTASQAVYEIRGDYIHKAHSASQPEFKSVATGFTRLTARLRPSMKSADRLSLMTSSAPSTPCDSGEAPPS